MILTDLFKLKKPEPGDFYDVADFNANTDIIERELQNRPEKTGEASQMTVTFSEREGELQSGDSLGELAGKIRKKMGDSDEKAKEIERKVSTLEEKVGDGFEEVNTGEIDSIWGERG